MATLGSVVVCSTVRQPAWGQATGSYRGRVVAEWIGPRNMRLVEPFKYMASNGRRWPVPSGVVVDGASIPQMLWSLIGGPFEGLYRAASVVHDRFCDTRTRKYPDVHQMFFEHVQQGDHGGLPFGFYRHRTLFLFGRRLGRSRVDRGDRGGYSGILSQNTVALFLDRVFPILSIPFTLRDI
jgi:hypothetical protein